MVGLISSVGRGQRSGGRLTASRSGSGGDIAVRFENGAPDGRQLVACQLRQFPKDSLQWRRQLVRAPR